MQEELTELNRILIADDDRLIRRLLHLHLKNKDYLIDWAEDGQEAYDYITKREYDLIVLDVFMPFNSGLELLELAKELKHQKDTPVIMLTGNSETENKNTAFSLGAVDYIPKPFNSQEAVHRIEAQLKISSYTKQIKNYAQKMEKLAEERAQQLIHADRLVTLGTLAAGIAHEINNPLTYISGNAEIVENNFWPVIKEGLEAKEEKTFQEQMILEEMPSSLKSIHNGVERVHKIINGLKTFSRKESRSTERFCLNDAIKSSISFAESTISEKVKLNFDSPEFKAEIKGDRQKIEQVLINLIVNASHACEKSKSANITIEASLNGQLAIIVVSDNGTGIPNEILQDIWTPFFTTKESGKGTGLGLCINKEIIEEHKGTITAFNRKDTTGAQFTICLPLGEDT